LDAFDEGLGGRFCFVHQLFGLFPFFAVGGADGFGANADEPARLFISLVAGVVYVFKAAADEVGDLV
jgi:hypothetical protein